MAVLILMQRSGLDFPASSGVKLGKREDGLAWMRFGSGHAA